MIIVVNMDMQCNFTCDALSSSRDTVWSEHACPLPSPPHPSIPAPAFLWSIFCMLYDVWCTALWWLCCNVTDCGLTTYHLPCIFDNAQANCVHVYTVYYYNVVHVVILSVCDMVIFSMLWCGLYYGARCVLCAVYCILHASHWCNDLYALSGVVFSDYLLPVICGEFLKKMAFK